MSMNNASNASNHYTSSDDSEIIRDKKDKATKLAADKASTTSLAAIAQPIDDSKPSSMPPQHNSIAVYDVNGKRVTSLTKYPPVPVVNVRQESDTNIFISISSNSGVILPSVVHTTTSKAANLEPTHVDELYHILTNLEPAALHEDHRPANTSIPDDSRLSTTSSDTRQYNRTLNVIQDSLFRITKKHKQTPEENLPGFKYTVDKHHYPIEKDNTFTKKNSPTTFFPPLIHYRYGL